MKRNPFMVVMITLGAILGFILTLVSGNANNNAFLFGSVLGAISLGCIALIIEVFLNAIVS